MSGAAGIFVVCSGFDVRDCMPEEISNDCKLVAVFRGEEPVIAELGKALREYMLEEAPNKFRGWEIG